jgi:hypothetical protein
MFGWRHRRWSRRADQLIALFGHYPTPEELAERRAQYEEKMKVRRAESLVRLMAAKGAK